VPGIGDGGETNGVPVRAGEARLLGGIDPRRVLEEETGRAFPGAVLLVRSRGQDRLVAATGWTAEEGTGAVRAQVTPDTLFDVASLTKAIGLMPVALALAAEGRLDLSAPVGRYLSWTRDRWIGAVTTDLLLRHASGLAAWRPYGPEFCAERGLSSAGTPGAREYLRRRLASEEPESPPGTACVYSDLGYLVAQEVCEAAGGAPLDVLFRQRVAGPLGLVRTSFRPIRRGRAQPLSPGEAGTIAATECCPLRGRCLQGEVHDENAWVLGGVAGHAGLFSTAPETARIVQALRDSWAGTRDWLPRDLLREAWDPGRRLPGSTRLLGLDTPSPSGSLAGDRAPEGTAGHLGFTGTSFWVDLPGDAIVVLLSHRVHPTRDREGIREARRRIHDACWDWIRGGQGDRDARLL